MEEVAASYSDVFKGLGCMEGALPLQVDKTVALALTGVCLLVVCL